MSDINLDNKQIEQITSEFDFKDDYPLQDMLEKAFHWYEVYKDGSRHVTETQQLISLDKIGTAARKLRINLEKLSIEARVRLSMMDAEGFDTLDSLLSAIAYPPLRKNSKGHLVPTTKDTVRFTKKNEPFYKLMADLRAIYVKGTGNHKHWAVDNPADDDQYTSPYHHFVMICLATACTSRPDDKDLKKTDSALHKWLTRHREIRDIK